MLLTKSHLYVRKLAFIQRLDLTSEQLTLTNVSTRTRFIFARIVIARGRERKKKITRSLKSPGYVRSFPLIYVKVVYTRASKKKK